MSYGFVMGLSLACVQLGILLDTNAVIRLSAKGPASLQVIAGANPEGGLLWLLFAYVVRKVGVYNLILPLFWSIILDMAIGVFFGQIAKTFLREMAKSFNRQLKDPDKIPYKRKILSLVMCCFISPAIVASVYVGEHVTIFELILLVLYYYLLQFQRAPYAACVSTMLLLFEPKYIPIAMFTAIFCLAWVFPALGNSTRRYRNYFLLAFGRILYILLLQAILISIIVLPFFLTSENPASFVLSRLRAIVPVITVTSGDVATDTEPHELALPSIWTIFHMYTAVFPEGYESITHYIESHSLYVWSAGVLVLSLLVGLPVMRTHVQLHTGSHKIYPVIACLNILVSFVFFVPGRSYPMVVAIIIAIYYIVLDLISSAQMATQRGIESTVTTERTHVGLLHTVASRSSLRQRQFASRFRCANTGFRFSEVAGSIPIKVVSIKQTPFASLEKDSPCFQNDVGNAILQRRLKTYNAIRQKYLSSKLRENSKKMDEHPFNDLFEAKGITAHSSVFRTLSLRERQQKKVTNASQNSSNSNKTGAHSTSQYNGAKDSLHNDDSLSDSEDITTCLLKPTGIHSQMRSKVDAASMHLLDFFEEYKDRVRYLIPSTLIMLFFFCNMYVSVQTTGVLRLYNHAFHLSSFLSLARAFKGDAKIVAWGLPFLCVDVFRVETVLGFEGVQIFLALFLLYCSTILLVFIGFGEASI